MSRDLATQKLGAGHIAAMSLALVAGFVDAYGYWGWHVFGANMTGNTIIFAISLRKDSNAAYLSLMLIVAFFVGAILGRLIRKRFKSHTALYAEAALLGVASFTSGSIALPIISLAMGMQNSALIKFAGVEANTSFLSGDYTKLAQAIADLTVRRGTARDRTTISIIFSLIAAYVCGALISAFCNGLPLRVLFVVPVVLALAVATHRRVLNP